MTDRELLEKAAKSAKIPTRWAEDLKGFIYDVDYGYSPREMWSPLKDDGDAFRLAVSLNIWPVRQEDRPTIVVQKGSACFDDLVSEPIGDDVCASVRRAIVRAAAALCGKPT